MIRRIWEYVAAKKKGFLLRRRPLLNTFNSEDYWSQRYHSGGNSGAGSRGRLAAFKAEVINEFVANRKISSVIEFGCGEGAQLELAKYPEYLGFDVAPKAVEMCSLAFEADRMKSFKLMSGYGFEKADLTLSLDVIYHLIEDSAFHEYMSRLFFSANRYVIIYSSNYDGLWPAEHVKHRKFTDWIERNHIDFRLHRHIPNRYPLPTEYGPINSADESFSEFYIFERVPQRRHTLPGHLVVSLTSHAKRFSTLEFTLRRILQQSMIADETVLWLSPDDSKLLPGGVRDLQHMGLSIKITKDVGPHTKIIPALRMYPDSFIITLDDDQIYPRDVIEPLIANYRSPKEILCRRANLMKFGSDGLPLPYMQWQFDYPEESDSSALFPTGVNGILYPPGSLAPEVLNEDRFRALTPSADDIWLFFMGRLAGSKVRRVGRHWQNEMWPGAHESSLMHLNWNGGNDRQLQAMIREYGSPFGKTSD